MWLVILCIVILVLTIASRVNTTNYFTRILEQRHELQSNVNMASNGNVTGELHVIDHYTGVVIPVNDITVTRVDVLTSSKWGNAHTIFKGSKQILLSNGHFSTHFNIDSSLHPSHAAITFTVDNVEYQVFVPIQN